MQALSPISIPLTSPPPITIQLDGQQRAGITPAKLRLENESPYLLTVSLGGDTHHLAAWTADVFAVPPGATQCGVTPTLLTGQLNPPSSLLLPSVAAAGEDFPGTYPMPLPRQTATWTNEQPIPNSPFTFARDGNFHNINGLQLPADCQALVFGTATQSDIEGLTVTGTTTGVQYAPVLLVGLTPLLYVRVHPAIDPVVNLSLQISSGAGSALVGIVFVEAANLLELDPLIPNPVFLETDLRLPVAVDVDVSGNVNRLGVSLSGAVAGQVKDGTPDWQVFANQNGAGGPASCGSGVSGTKRAVLHAVTFSVVAGAARIFRGRIWDGPSGGTQVGTVVIGNPGAAAGNVADSKTLWLRKSSPGNALTFDFDFAAAAGEHQTIDAAGYFQ